MNRGVGWLAGLLVLGLSAWWMGSALSATKAAACLDNGGLGALTSTRRVDRPLDIWQKQDLRRIDRMFDSVQSDFDPELLKAIAWVETRWQHWKPDRLIFVTTNHKKGKPGHKAAYVTLDWGLMQINDRLESLDARDWTLEYIQTDPEYNLRAAIAVLASKRDYIKRLRRRPNWQALQARYRLQGHDDTDILLKAYNGFQPSWAYVDKVKAAWANKPWQEAIWRQWSEQAIRPREELGANFDPTMTPVPRAIPAVVGSSRLNDINYDASSSETIYSVASVSPLIRKYELPALDGPQALTGTNALAREGGMVKTVRIHPVP